MDRADRPMGTVADIQHGWDVYGSDEQKVGNVAEVHDGYIVAHKGFFFTKDLYIPNSAFQRIEHDRVYLNVPKDEVDAQGWDSPLYDDAPATEGPPPKPDAVGTPGLTGVAEEGGRRMRASMSDTQTDRTAAMGARAEGADDQMYRGDSGHNAMPAEATGGEKLDLHEEELQVTKEQVQKGEVRVGKRVVEEEQTINVPVRREEVFIERRPGDGQPDDHPVGEDKTDTIRIPLREERVQVEKVPVQTGEVRIGKREVVDTQHVTDTVKREEPRIESSGDVDLSRTGMGAGTMGRWEDVRPAFRDDWQRQYGNSGRRWEDVEANYRYGWEMAGDPRYSGRSWTQVEPELQQDWQRTRHQSAWDHVRDDIHSAWDRATGH